MLHDDFSKDCYDGFLDTGEFLAQGCYLQHPLHHRTEGITRFNPASSLKLLLGQKKNKNPLTGFTDDWALISRLAFFLFFFFTVSPTV